jgi:hypothetical protein
MIEILHSVQDDRKTTFARGSWFSINLNPPFPKGELVEFLLKVPL